MSLTGHATLVLGALVTVGLPVLVVLFGWERVRGPRWARLSERLAMLAGCQMAALLLGFLVLNNYAGFFDTWAQVAKTVYFILPGGQRGSS